MSATYLSLQVADTPSGEIKAAVEAFNRQSGEQLQAYIGPPLGRWTALYTKFSLASDLFAKHLSGITGGVVVALASLDEDDFLCNVCLAGKDMNFFKVSTHSTRKGKQRHAVIKRIELLSSFAEVDARSALIERLCDTRSQDWSSDILADFCSTLGIRNGRCSYDYIAKNEYQNDLDELVTLEHVG